MGVEKGRQLQMRFCEGRLWRVPAEQGEYIAASDAQGIAPDETINMYQSKSLLERIVSKANLREAYKRVRANRGAAGIDKMEVDELHDYFQENADELIGQLLAGKYTPAPVRRVEIPKKEKGKVRKLGIPTVIDRVVQQAVCQVLSPLFEPQFSKHSYGFRPKRGAHDALRACQENVDDGYSYVVDMDLKKFFDTVCQSKLIQILSETVTDGRVVSLIHKYLHAGVMVKGRYEFIAYRCVAMLRRWLDGGMKETTEHMANLAEKLMTGTIVSG